jgi:hypothetical protein
MTSSVMRAMNRPRPAGPGDPDTVDAARANPDSIAIAKCSLSSPAWARRARNLLAGAGLA